MPRGVLRSIIAAVVLVAVVAGLSVVAQVGAPRVSASSADLTAQRAATERAIERIYAAATDQLKTTRSLHLAITDAQAATIEQRYTDQLKALRLSALQAVANGFGESGDAAAQYAAQAASRLDGGPLASAPAVMLAPSLYAIVQRMGQLAADLQDRGIKEMTQAPGASPTARPSPTPTASPSRSPSPSPTR